MSVVEHIHKQHITNLRFIRSKPSSKYLKRSQSIHKIQWESNFLK